MTIGDLLDKLREVERMEKEVEDWKRSVENGGNADTMRRKRECLESAENYLHGLRMEQIEL